jgi:hypothetical protein
MLYDLNTLEKIERLKKGEARVVALLKEVSAVIPEDEPSLELLKKDISEEINASKITRLRSLMSCTMW